MLLKVCLTGMFDKFVSIFCIFHINCPLPEYTIYFIEIHTLNETENIAFLFLIFRIMIAEILLPMDTERVRVHYADIIHELSKSTQTLRSFPEELNKILKFQNIFLKIFSVWYLLLQSDRNSEQHLKQVNGKASKSSNETDRYKKMIEKITIGKKYRDILKSNIKILDT